ncbi:MAG: hypothetical protein SVZ03_08080 [Spirochaetota bacterium]|nr:hypothetical protein [Spirochaetota bacterium]
MKCFREGGISYKIGDKVNWVQSLISILNGFKDFFIFGDIRL